MKWIIHLSLKTKLYCVFLIPLCLLIFSSFLFKINANKLIETSFWVEHTHEVIAEGQLLNRLMIDMETGLRGYLITGNGDFLEPYHLGIKTWNLKLTSLIQTVSDNPTQIEQLKKIDQMKNIWLDKVVKVSIDLRKKANQDVNVLPELTQMIDSKIGKNSMDKIRIELQNFIDHEEELIRIRVHDSENAAQQTEFFIYFITSLSLIIVAIILITLNKYINKNIGDLMKATQKVMSGDYETKISVTSKDELGILSEAFNQMAEKISMTQNTLIQNSKMASLGNMAAGIAHELNQPLGAISMNCETTLVCFDKGKLEQAKEICTQNVQQIHRATSIIDGLRKFSRETNHKDLQSCDINNLVQNVLVILENDMKLSNIHVIKKFVKSPPKITVSEIQIEQILSNLLTNAKDALNTHKNKRIEITTYYTQQLVYIKISDNGSGMDKKVQDKIFEPFFTTKEIGDGTGLGLSLSYGMVKSNQGAIEVESELNQGTTFTLSFPIEEKTT